MEMTTENAGQRGWMLVKLEDEEKTGDVAVEIWEANEGDWLKARGSDIELGCVSRADVVRLDAIMAVALGCKVAIVVPVTLKDGATPEDAIEAIKGYAGEGAEVFWLQALAHNPGIAVEEDGIELSAPALSIPSPLDKEGPTEDTPTDTLMGHSAWG
jgi:hypothetical protein